jgi:polygalacturonase
MRNLITILLLSLIYSGCINRSHEFVITRYGAKSDSKHINTAAINKAIESCNNAGGGRVIIPPGTWYTGTLELLSNVELHLMHGAILKGSPNIDDYVKDGKNLGILYAFNAKNISISGNGEIDGNGTVFFDSSRPHDGGDFNRKFIRQGEEYMKPGFDFSDGPIFIGNRPGMTVVLMHCEDVSIKNIKISDTPSWTLRIGDCDDVDISGITIINNLLVPNSDGIHCTHSRNVRISNCDIRAGDDAIIVTGFGAEEGSHLGDGTSTKNNDGLYGNKGLFSENVVVTNCVLQSRSAGVRVGYGPYPIRNCIFSNLVIYDSNRGVAVFARDDATIENIYFNNIIIRNRLHSGHWWGNGEPIHVSTIPQTAGMKGGNIKNIRFSNITADSETGIIIWGSEENRIENIEFHDIDLHIRKSNLSDSYGGNVDLRPTLKDENKLFKFDLPGIYIQKSDDILIRNLQLSWDNNVPDYHTYGIELNDVTGFDIDQKSRYPSRPGSFLPSLKK